ncbi:MAG: hypothetical protein KA368_14320 [Acidobacteria bacterium]|nr:hypothetical protein [Acidobacteriota bacterium]
MSKQFLKLFRTALLMIFAFSLLLPVSAQKQTASEPKKSTGTSTTCDGALDIVPTKAMSFVRKRRPAKGEAKQQTSSADSKASPKPPNN